MSGVDGVRVLLTRTESGCEAWGRELESRGARPVPFPCIRREILSDARAPLRQALRGASWLALASAFAAAATADLLGDRLPEGVRVAAVGPATAAAARECLGRVDLEAAEGTGDGLARELAETLGPEEGASGPVVAAAAEGGRRDLEEVLEPRGFTVRRVSVYRTSPYPRESERRSLSGVADVVLLASPSAVEGLLHRASVPEDLRVITIGPTTTAAARSRGLRVDGEATDRSLEGMLEMIR